ncbi:type II secretion system protein GspM [Pseudoruegeria sp. HB172150]|uniref:type II secretion system protein GspM n=1 Tax=Pseudoruegeria sp. HB172150 TaxID=2721164 RepID=UPI001551F099|nr:type II secretion system protein GspM [Pseudoruegeria sp. HB172150]
MNRLAPLSPRESALLILLGTIVPLALILLVVMPLLETRTTARIAAAEAEDLRNWVALRVADLPSEGPMETRKPFAQTSLAALEQSLVAAGLRSALTRLADTPGGVEIAFGPVRFDALTQWLHDTSPRWGYDVAAYRIARVTSGLVTARFTLTPTH